ncbi:MAG: hypothetical protein QM785_12360 [Pyrinomonadaceae bacterium]
MDNIYQQIPDNLQRLSPEEKEKLRRQFELQARERLDDLIRMLEAGKEDAIKTIVASYFDPPAPADPKKIEITPVHVFFMDMNTYMPLGEFGYSVFGSASEVSRNIIAKGERLLDTKEARKSQSAVYRRLRDTFKLSAAEAASYFIPENASKDEKERIKMRLRASYTRYKKDSKDVRKGTKPAKRTPLKTPKK